MISTWIKKIHFTHELPVLDTSLVCAALVSVDEEFINPDIICSIRAFALSLVIRKFETVRIKKSRFFLKVVFSLPNSFKYLIKNGTEDFWRT